ncbi:hypothetical protein SAMD00019534_039960 [Acytostelium subglobosum LB1]|uniref:hypothetical protein n=1 Tax=Acytostelium subglobosum LB1 TaxID=1410327 RepID=UPI000644A80A|nr:hypothetical protein SAMD00019534_039960 [Acytostelium subglobosum LB1]GAM20821.1 hypothetical protein SAMD00019534_039960 [Acytostelium subglobosum LB1]|eukprot:XP_012755955.1 hypothetical protein SAMD00019534_039960 [Acytostelium subglobosum LB1]
MSLSVQGLANDAPRHISENINKLIKIIERLGKMVDEIPPREKRTRFGNESFADWFDQCEKESTSLINGLLSSNDANDNNNNDELSKEMAVYLNNSFGDRTRIDYGSGHELNFICFLYCLCRVGYFTREDYTALVLNVFYGYIGLMRKLQATYWLEPAGSHGVWGLDDYHFLPFLFGSSQLIEHQYIRPKSIRSAEVVSSFADKYMYLQCISFILQVKTGSLMEHSPMLVDISGVRNWSKVNEGMIKMYKSELMSKLPVMQHFFFGSLIEFKDDPNVVDDGAPEARVLKVHSFSCCGCTDKVPSMFAAAPSATKSNLTSSSSTSADVCEDTSHHHHPSDGTHLHTEHNTNVQKTIFPLD